ncbi:three-Cys-motif partner protein TcmP [Echinicola soli]|uniref:Three-Cys-motif partner protein TcmP n=1 Tax=Echinicola soli TaxID=2591634 RepID=A0A514CFZ3_9BACT|nr:three-Cys-motif partner protein TcmP [Echinicola soli]QDH78732.1 three-Cys-motif partner protein TcmP [Echinicola soli]
MKESQTQMLNHSEAKVRLLDTYIQKYLNILSRSQHVADIYLYDLFCGSGVYENGGEGSPVIFMRAIKNMFFRNESVGIENSSYHCWFNDIDADKIQKVEQYINDKKLYYPQFGDLKISSKEYEAILPDVIGQINKLKREKAFVFIDPYGYKNISLNHIKKLLESKKSEVLLFLPTQFMFRFERKGAPECLKKFIRELLPEREWPNSHTGIDFIENLKSAFRSHLGNEYYVDTFIIKREANQYFCLFFFTSHIYGFEKMLEAKWQVDKNEGRGWDFNANGSMSLFVDQVSQARVNKLEASLLSHLKIPRTNVDLYWFILHEGFRTVHGNDVLKRLSREGKINVTPVGGEKTRRGAFYLGHDYYKDNLAKILVKSNI